MIYILYECNKTTTKELVKQIFLTYMLVHAGMEVQCSKLRSEERNSLTKLFLALSDSVLQENLPQEIENTLLTQRNDLRNHQIRYASAHEIKEGDTCRYLICLENHKNKQDEGIQFILYHSDVDEAIQYKEGEGLVQIYVNLARLDEDNVLTRFAKGFDDLMVKEPSLQLLEDVCAMHPLFTNTFPYLLMFLCNANHFSVNMRVSKGLQPMMN